LPIARKAGISATVFSKEIRGMKAGDKGAGRKDEGGRMKDEGRNSIETRVTTSVKPTGGVRWAAFRESVAHQSLSLQGEGRVRVCMSDE
jgi:hypothetical protein